MENDLEELLVGWYFPNCGKMKELRLHRCVTELCTGYGFLSSGLCNKYQRIARFIDKQHW
jgi:hypothetical protein